MTKFTDEDPPDKDNYKIVIYLGHEDRHPYVLNSFEDKYIFDTHQWADEPLPGIKLRLVCKNCNVDVTDFMGDLFYLVNNTTAADMEFKFYETIITPISCIDIKLMNLLK